MESIIHIGNVRELILHTAEELIMIKGINNTSLADIAKSAKISKGTLYYHFPTKDELIYEITESHLRKFTDDIFVKINSFKNSEQAPYIIIRELFRNLTETTTRSKFHIYLLNEIVCGNEKLKERFKEKYKEWKKLIEEGISEIYGKDNENNEVLAVMILSMLDGLAIQNMLNVDNIEMEKICAYIAKNK